MEIRLQSKEYVTPPEGGGYLKVATDLNSLVTDSVCSKCGVVKEQHTAKDKHCTLDVRLKNIEERCRESSSKRSKRIRFALKPRTLADLWSRYETLVCYYCAIPEQYSQVLVSNPRNRSQRVVRFGLDRIDSDYGYMRGNIVFCCSDCNQMKGTKNALDFLEFYAPGRSREWLKYARKMNLFIPDDWELTMLRTRIVADEWNVGFGSPRLVWDYHEHNRMLLNNLLTKDTKNYVSQDITKEPRN